MNFSKNIIKSIIFVTIFISFIALHAAEVGKIKFNQSGALKRSTEYLTLNLSLQPGTKFTQEKLNKDIKRLKGTGYFTDVEADVTNRPNDKVDITFNLTNTSRIKKIVVDGNKKYSTEELMEHITLHPGEPLNEKLLRKSLTNLQRLYTEHGYYDAKIYPRTEVAKNGDLIVTFHIVENLKQKVNGVQFVGNTAFSSWDLKDVIQTHYSYLNLLSEIDFTGLIDKYLNPGLYNKVEVDRDKLRLRNLYWTKGYLDFSVKTKIEELKDDPEWVDVIFTIHEGKPYKIGAISVEGNTLFKTEELLKLVTLKSGEIYDYRKEERSVKEISAKYDRLGYCDFKCKPEISADFQNHTVDIVFNVYEGPAYSVRNINISGQRRTKDYVIRRELPMEPGEPVDNVLIDAGKSRLMAMNYFKNVEAYTTSTGVPGEKDVNYKVQEKGTAHVSVGAGWSSSDSLVGRLALSEANFDITDPYTYFRGGGQRIDLLAQVGLERMDFALDFSEPWLFGIPLRLDTSGFFHQREYEFWNEQHMGFSIGLTKQIGEFNMISLGYTLDFAEAYDMSDQYSQSFRDAEQGSSRLGALRLLLERDTRNNLMNPTSGYKLSASSEMNSVALAGSSNYYKLDLSASGFWNFFDEFLVLHLGAKIGTMGGFCSNDNIPFYRKYFLGGQNSIRGFQYRRVSPLNSNGLPLGGQSMFVATAEITHPIYKWIKGAAFVDVGGAWSKAFEFSHKVNVGVGYGLRILVPQLSNAPIRLDLGVPVYRAESAYSTSPQFYFDVGFNW